MLSLILVDFLNMGTPEIMMIAFVALLLFGGKKLPELARGLGKGIREFKDASDGVKREIQRNINDVSNDYDTTANTVAESYSYSPPEEPAEEEADTKEEEQPAAEEEMPRLEKNS